MGYTIREAGAGDVPALAEIERAAAELFRQSSHPEATGLELSVERVDFQIHRVWVVESVKGRLVAFAMARALEGSVHLEEIDVHPAHGRRGLGRRLIEVVSDWARDLSVAAVTLTTYADVPWNAPYYMRLGFRIMEVEELSDELAGILAEESRYGLDPATRVCMRLSV